MYSDDSTTHNRPRQFRTWVLGLALALSSAVIADDAVACISYRPHDPARTATKLPDGHDPEAGGMINAGSECNAQ